jgi:acyl transferase domain-containing protein/acyl carrier protein
MTEIDYDSAIAVIGMSGRFPGANDVESFWDNLMAGRAGVRELTEDELLEAGVSPALLANPAYVRVGAPVDGIDMFDAAMFGFSRHEAEMTEPQHRLMLESCWEALESSGYPPLAMPGRVGVFTGCGFPGYLFHLAPRVMNEPGGKLLMAIGTERDSLSSLISYKLDLRGPSVTVQTFCSTSLVAVHFAIQSLLNFECETALAGGVFIEMPHGVGYLYEDGGIYAPDGVVRAFDSGARGSVIGSGVSAVVLKRLADALADGDHIEAVILGSAVNNDGRACPGYTAPGVDGQAEVMREALSVAGVAPESIGYVECHGTGTMLGDSVELAALARAYPKIADRPIVLASLKASIGHTDRASGTTGLIRAAKALSRRVLPATPNFQDPNPALVTARDRFTVLTEHQPWPVGPEPRRAGVSSFGLGGTNAHVIVEEAPRRPDRPEARGPHLLVLSARDATALDDVTADLARHLGKHPDIRLDDVAFTLQESRTHFAVRRTMLCADVEDARAALNDRGRWLDAEPVHRGPLVDLVLANLADVPPSWWSELQAAAGRVLEETTEPEEDGVPADLAALRALVAALSRLGCRTGRLIGRDGAHELAQRLTEERPSQGDDQIRTTITIEPAALTGSATDWFLSTIARLWLAGVHIRWRALHGEDPRRVPLPTYPFQRRRYWIDPIAFPFGGDSPEEGRSTDLSRWTYAPAWRFRPAEIADRSEALCAAGPWLVLAGDDVGEALIERLRIVGADVVAARPGDQFAGAGADFTVRPDQEADLIQLIGSLPQPPRTVLHALSVGPGGSAGRAFGTQSLLALTGVLAAHTVGQRVDLLALTEEALSVAGAPPKAPEHAAISGLVPVLAQENPGWRCRHVDVVRAAGTRRLAALAVAVLDEAVIDHEGPVALRGTNRWVRDYEHRPLPASPPHGPLASDAVVLITGGLGHVGLILARHLAVRHGYRVVLTGRTELPQPQRWRDWLARQPDPSARTARLVSTLVELEDAGGQVLVVRADVSDEQQMRAAVRAAVDRFGPIDLVVHAAGISDTRAFGPAHMVDPDAVRAHFSAKVDGFETLRRVLADQDYAGITLSSLSAVLGGLALGPYAAANAALDGCALAERAAGGRWLTVDWDTWQPDSGTEQNSAHNGAFDMTRAEALEIFDRAVAAIDQVDHLVISTGALDARYAQWVLRQGSDDAEDEDDGIRDPRPDLSTPFVEPAEGTQRVIADVWARVLRLDKVGADDDFFRLGGTSVLAIELIAIVRRELGIPVPVSAMLGFPTIRGLAEQIDMVE